MVIDCIVLFIAHLSSKAMPNSDAPGFQSFIKSASGILSVFDTGLFETKSGCSPGGQTKPMVRARMEASYTENVVWQYWADQKPVFERVKELII
jgi:hypothetical protein